MPIVWIPFDGWSPSGSYFGDGWNAVTNLYPAYGDWRPWRKFQTLGAGVADGPMTGAYVHMWASGIGTSSYAPDAQTLFTGSPTRLYTVNPTTGAFTDVSRAASYGPDFGGWRFASVGNDIWATDWLDPLQRRTNNAGFFANGAVSTFKPQPRFIAAIREHLVGANLSNAGRFQDEVVWSDADDATNWDPPTLTSTSIAGSKRLVSIPGQLTGLVGGQYGLAFKRLGIFYLEYAGPPAIFRPDVLSTNVGTAFPSSVIDSRYGVFFMGPDGFYQISGLSEPQKISTPGIEQFILDTGLTAATSSFRAWAEDIQLIGFRIAHLPLVGWAFRYDITDPGNDFALLYNPVLSRWAQVQLSELIEFSTGPTCFFQRPYAGNLYSALAALTYGSGASAYAPLASTGDADTIWPPDVAMNFRPANFDASELQQSTIAGVLPIFSKTVVSGDALTPQVTIEPILDPYQGVFGTPEVRTAGDRNQVSGYYPFLVHGRMFRISIQCSAEDFANFDGCWIDQRLLT
jgi:hypothetical protein